MYRNITLCLALLCAGLLAACGSGKNLTASGGSSSSGNPGNNGGNGSSSSAVQGIYRGVFNPPAGSAQVYGAVLPTGFGFFADIRGDTYIMPAVSNGTDITGTLTGYAPAGVLFPNGQRTISYTMIGSASNPDSTGAYQDINATVSTGALSGSLALNYYSLSASIFPAKTLAGTYQGFYWGSSVAVNFTISPAGVISGNDGSGCSLSGIVTNASGSTNLFQVSLQITGSSNCPGSLSGAGFTDQNDNAHLFAAPTDHLLYFGLTGGGTADPLRMRRPISRYRNSRISAPASRRP
jgi:hypothetical protein